MMLFRVRLFASACACSFRIIPLTYFPIWSWLRTEKRPCLSSSEAMARALANREGSHPSNHRDSTNGTSAKYRDHDLCTPIVSVSIANVGCLSLASGPDDECESVVSFRLGIIVFPFIYHRYRY